MQTVKNEADEGLVHEEISENGYLGILGLDEKDIVEAMPDEFCELMSEIEML